MESSDEEILKVNNYKIRLISESIKWLRGFECIDSKRYPKIIALLDVQLKLCLAVLDIQIGLKYLHIAITKNNKAEANYFARVVIFNSYTIFESISTLETIKIIRKDGEASKNIDGIIKGINKLHKTAKYFKDIRDDFAHRFSKKAGTGIEQLNKTAKIDVKSIYKIGDSLFDKSFALTLILLEFSRSLTT